MRSVLVLIIFILLGVQTARAQEYWSRIYQQYPDEYDDGTQIIAEDERILVACSVGDSLFTSELATVRILDQLGELSEHKMFSIPNASTFNNSSLPNSFLEHQSGGYIWFVFPGYADIWVRFDETLDTLYTDLLYNPINENEFFNIHQIFADSQSEEYFAFGTTDWAISGGEILMKMSPDGEILEFYPDIVDDHYIEIMLSREETDDGNLLIAGYTADYDEDFSPPFEYDAYIGKFTTTGENIWEHNFGHPDYNDEHAVAIELPDESVAFYYVETDSIYSNATPWSTFGTMKRIHISNDGVVLDTMSYFEGLRGAKFYDIQEKDGRVYAMGQLWGLYNAFFKSFLLITDDVGNLLNYSEFFHLECAECENYLYDLDIAPNGDIAMVGYVELDTLDYDQTHKTWVVKVDCMGKFEAPPLSFSAEINQNGDTLSCTSIGEGVFEFAWDFGAGPVQGNVQEHVFSQPGIYTIQATGTYCTTVLDTSFTITITDCLGNTEIPELNLDPQSSFLGDSLFQFTASSEILENVIWYINDEELIGNDVQYNFPDTGNFTVEVCGWYCDSLYCEWLDINVPVSVQEIPTSSQAINISPNPIQNNRVNIQSSSLIQSIRILDMTGKLMHTQKANATNVEVYVPGLASGSYLVECRFENGERKSELVMVKERE